MNKNLLTAALGLVTIGLTIAVGVQQREIRTLNRQIAAKRINLGTAELEHQEQIAQLREENNTALVEAHREAERLQDTLRRHQEENDRLARNLAESTARTNDADATAPAPDATPSIDKEALLAERREPHLQESEDGETEETPLSQMAKMMKEPAMRELMRSQQRVMVDMTYKSLYDTLELDDDMMDQLKKILLDKQMGEMEMGLDVMDETLTEEQRREILDGHEITKAEYEDALRELLGKSDYEWFESYEQTKAERIKLNMFAQSLEDSLRLQPNQEDALALAMYEARSQHNFLSDLQDPGKMNLSQFNEEMILKVIEDLKSVNQQSIARAVDILNPEQHKLFVTFLEQQQTMQEMAVKMSLKMFQKEKK